MINKFALKENFPMNFASLWKCIFHHYMYSIALSPIKVIAVVWNEESA